MSTEVDPNLISENLAELLQNTVNMTSVFYDLFINPVPMDVELKQWDNEGNIVTVSIPNRAKDNQRATVGTVDPEGVVVAPVGSFYVNSTNNAFYVKVSGDDSTGWKVTPTDEGIQAYISQYISELEFITEPDLEQYLTDNNYTTDVQVEGLIKSTIPAPIISTLEPLSSISLEDNKNYMLSVNGSDITLILPSVSDLTKIHRIFIQLNLVTVQTIDLGTTYYFEKTAPDLSTTGSYDLYFEYDNIIGHWVVGSRIKGLAE